MESKISTTPAADAASVQDKHDALPLQEPVKETKAKRSFSLPKKSAFAVAIIAVLVISGWLLIPHHNLTPTPTGATTVSHKSAILAEVNGEPIYKDDFIQETKLYFFLQGISESDKAKLTQEQLMNKVITEKLFLQKADEAGYVVPFHFKEDIEKQVFKNNPSVDPAPENKFKAALSKKGIDYDFFISYMAKSIAIEKFLNDKVINNLIVTDKEAETYYAAHKTDFVAPEQIKVSHILVNNTEQAQKIIQELDKGQNFALLAKANSIDSNAAKGGDLGYVHKGMLVPEFETAAFALQNIGDYTKSPIKTNYGYHIILLTGRKKAGQLSFDEVKDVLKKQLLSQKQTEKLDNYMVNLKKNATIKTH